MEPPKKSDTQSPNGDADKVWNVDRAHWRATHDSSITEYPATRFFMSMNGPLVRIAFGQMGPPTDEQGGFDPPRFQVAVSMPPAMAAELKSTLDQWFARQQGEAPAAPAASETTAPKNGGGEAH